MDPTRSSALIGSSFSHYRITALLGRGGMGEVYRATDERLGREVALKLLPEGFAEDAERRSRFEREARLLAALNHPNVATLYGLEADGGRHALVLELVEGEGLDQRIARGALDGDDLLAIARQIAAALAAAHGQGILHRDLKPANIRVRPDGTVKVLDFGLAKAWQPEPATTEMALSPTLTHQDTVEGVILGTAAYMSPEQARGRTLDRRTDLWSFGVVLWEMATGRALFAGETSSDTLAAVLRSEIEWSALSPSTPPQVASLLHLLLQRDPAHRLPDAGAAGVLLEVPAAATPSPARGRPRGLLLSVLAAIALAAIAAALAWSLRPEASPPPLRKVTLEEIGGPGGLEEVRPAISPDGRRVAFAREGAIHVRDLAQLESRRLDGTEQPQMLAWSPDAQWLAFASGTQLVKVPVDGGAVQRIADLPGRPSSASGAAWLPDGRIYFTTGGSGLLAVLAGGGSPETLLEPAEGEYDFHDASALPEGRGVLFTVHSQLEAATLAAFDGTGRVDVIRLEGEWLGRPVYSQGGFLLFERRTPRSDLWAVPFSAAELRTTGEPFLVATAAHSPSASAEGTLAYVPNRETPRRRLAWVDRAGELLETLGEALPGLAEPVLSPDGTRVAVMAEEQGNQDIWILDLAAGGWNRLTFSPTREYRPRWLPDGRRVAFYCGEPTKGRICVQAADGAGQAEVLMEDVGVSAAAGAGFDFSPDGRSLVYESGGIGSRIDIWLHELGGATRPLLATADVETSGQISPDGRWLAHVAWELGEGEVYVREFPSVAGKWQVSSHGGRIPVWGGDELFYLEGQTLVARRITAAGSVRIGPEQRLFEMPPPDTGYDVSRDGRRILTARPEGEGRPERLVLVQGWAEEFRRR